MGPTLGDRFHTNPVTHHEFHPSHHPIMSKYKVLIVGMGKRGMH